MRKIRHLVIVAVVCALLPFQGAAETDEIKLSEAFGQISAAKGVEFLLLKAAVDLQELIQNFARSTSLSKYDLKNGKHLERIFGDGRRYDLVYFESIAQSPATMAIMIYQRCSSGLRYPLARWFELSSLNTPKAFMDDSYAGRLEFFDEDSCKQFDEE